MEGLLKMEEIYTQISNLGFPIVVAFYLLVRVEGKLDKLSTCITDLSFSIERLNDKWQQIIPSWYSE